MSPEKVEQELSEIPHDGVSYAGPYIFDFTSNGPGKEAVYDYLDDSTPSGGRNPSSFAKLITREFIKRIQKKAPKILKDYPSFTLECIITDFPRLKNINENMKIRYEVVYNLHSLSDITQFVDRNNDKVFTNSDETHVNLDNFGKRGHRLSEYILPVKTSFSFIFHQTSYLKNHQERLDFLINLYKSNTKSVKLSNKQSYDALNMFGVIEISNRSFPDKNINDSAISALLKDNISQ